jgi:hypothetical protein
MTATETAQVLAIVRMLWPHSNLGEPRETLKLWHSFLHGFPAGDVEAAVRELAATGREHAPLVGVVVKTVTERVTDLPDWDEAWADIDRLIRSHGSYRIPAPGDFEHPLIAAFAIPAWTELCTGPAPGTNGHGTHYAQQRDAYRAMRGRLERGAALDAVAASRRRPLPRPLAAALEAAVPAGAITDGRAA